jgi:hypothetical protein
MSQPSTEKHEQISLTCIKDLQFPMESPMPARFVNAVLFVHARSDKNVIDGIARYFAKGDLFDLSRNEKKLQHVLRADAILTRTRHMLASSKDLAHDMKLKLLATLTVSIVEATLARKDSPEKRTIDEIVTDFADLFASLTSGSATAASAGSASEAMEKQSVNPVTYNEDGISQGIGRSKVLLKGFAVGNFVRLRTSSNWEQFEILAIEEDGTVQLRAVNAVDGLPGDIASVSRDTFISDYVITTHNIEVQANYPDKDATNSRALREAAVKGALQSCLYQLVQAHPAPNARVFKSPVKSVIALQAYAQGKLVITPGTLTVSIDRSTSDRANIPHDRAIVVKPVAAHYLDLDFRFLLVPVQTNDFINIMWCAKVVKNREEANCEMIERKCVQSVSIESLPYAKPSRAPAGAKAPTPLNPVTFGIQCAWNFKDIQENDEIVIYRFHQPSGASKRQKK